MDAAAAELLKHGILGVLLLIAMLAIWRLWDDTKDGQKVCSDQARIVAERHEALLKLIHDQRVADHQAMTAQLLRTTAEVVSALTTASNGLEATREAMAELKQAFVEERRERLSGRAHG